MKNPSYRALVKEALNYASRDDHKAAATAWLNAVDSVPRYDEAARLLCGREAMRAFNLGFLGYLPDAGIVVLLACESRTLDVFYWPLSRDGEGKRGRTRGAAFMAGGGTPVICIEGVAGYIALSHVLVVSDARKTL